MTAVLPAIGGTVDGARREANDTEMWSVTTIIGCLDKPALVPWAVNETAAKVVTTLDIIRRRLENEGQESAIEYVKGLRWHTGGLLSASQLGTLAHHLFDQWALSETGTRPRVEPEMHPDRATKGKVLDPQDIRDLNLMLDQFGRFLDEFQPSYQSTEVVVYDDQYEYAGQADAFLTIEGTPLICDYKTSRASYTGAGKERAPYPEVGLQLAAYRFAPLAAVWRARRYENQRRRYYLLSDTEKSAAVPVPEVDGGIAIHVSPHRYAVHPIRCDKSVHDQFLYVQEAARWSFETSKHVVGNPMMPPYPRPLPDADPFEGIPQ